jgi:two-component system sensor histidine kinase YesM
LKPTKIRRKSALTVRAKLMRAQLLLVLPLISLVLFGVLFFLYSSLTAELDNARNYSLQTAAGAFDRLYTRAVKILEIPYTVGTVYDVLAAESEDPDAQRSGTDFTAVSTALYKAVLYYEPNISAVTLVSELSGHVFYSRQPPASAVNTRNPDWYDLRRSAWYQEAVAVDEPVVGPAIENELYLGSGVTVPLSQRLKDVAQDRRLGAVRVDLNLSTLYREWEGLAQSEGDVFAVLDHAGQLVFASSPEFWAQHPLLSTPEVSAWEARYRLSGYQAPVSGFSFYLLSDESPAQFDARLLYGIPLLAALLCGVYAALFIHWSSRSISRPIQTLKVAMLHGQRKDLSVRCEPLAGEMGELSKAFNDLMDQVGELVGEVAAREQEKAKLAYEALQSKINPHFLYNTMNAIRWRADLLGAREVSHALEGLASLLRFATKSADELVPFAVELEQLENYIQIMRVRYGGDVDVSYDIDEACLEYRCLKFLFQPAVENCFIHAFGDSVQENKTILVKASCETACIRAVVEDNGRGMTGNEGQIEELLREGASRSAFAGIGLGSVRQRIRTLFGEGYDLRIESEPERYTRVTATIPKIRAEEVQE